MIELYDWLPLAAVGVTFSTVGLLKVYGFSKGIVGGGDRPASCRLLGSCPTWSKHINLIMVTLFLGIGLGCLGVLLMLILN
jgi:hypothetical protein